MAPVRAGELQDIAAGPIDAHGRIRGEIQRGLTTKTS